MKHQRSLSLGPPAVELIALRRNLERRMRSLQGELLEARDEVAFCEPGDCAAHVTRLSLENDTRALRSIDAALTRLAGERYGACCECGAEIAPARLRALPFAERCLACQLARERARHDPLDPGAEAMTTHWEAVDS